MALAIGVVLAFAALAYVLDPIVRPRGAVSPATPHRAPPSAGRTQGPRDVSDDEIEAAIRSYRASQSGARPCPVCGPRPEPDAIYCSSCGRLLAEAEAAG